jgi:hypothetical protein
MYPWAIITTIGSQQLLTWSIGYPDTRSCSHENRHQNPTLSKDKTCAKKWERSICTASQIPHSNQNQIYMEINPGL